MCFDEMYYEDETKAKQSEEARQPDISAQPKPQPKPQETPKTEPAKPEVTLV